MEEKYSEAKKVAQQIADVMQSKKIENEDNLKEWITMNPTSECVVDMLTDESKLIDAVRTFDKREIRHCSEGNLLRKIKISQQKRKRRICAYSGVAAAMIAVSMLVWNYDETGERNGASENHFIAKSLPMNVAAPTLILNNGKKINLNDSLTNQSIVKEGTSEIKYVEILDEALTEDYNTLIVPSRYTYSVILSDGTKVMLNANSKLIYPVKFGDEKREVALEGEAFFDVIKSDVPFVVKSNGVNVRVYGTKFNVNSYNCNTVETILISGSVGVFISGKENMLRPNQMSNVDVHSGSNDISEIDSNEHIAWINGEIKSYDANLGSFIEKMSFWYGENFTFFHEEKWNIPLTASFRQSQSIEEVISAIEYATKVKIEKTKGGYVIY